MTTQGLELNSAYFHDALLQDTDLSFTHLPGADFTGADVRDTNFAYPTSLKPISTSVYDPRLFFVVTA
jgi:uncharacterized protein YjbI with pentapeptide repeats